MVKNNLIVYNSYLQLKSFKLILVRAFCRGEFNKEFGSGLLWTVWSQSGSSLLFPSFTHTCSHSPHVRARAFSIAGFDDLTDREIRQREMVLSAKITESKHARLGRRHLDVSGHICVTKYTCTLHSYTATFFLLIITFVITNDIPENDFSKSTLDFNDCLSFASPWLISFAP